MEGNFGTFFLIGFAAYVVLMIIVGYISSKGKSEGKGYLTGGGQLPFFLIFADNGSHTDWYRFFNRRDSKRI